MRPMAALFFILFLAAGTAWADWDSGWGNDGVDQKTQTKTGNPPADGASRQRPRETIDEQPRDENAPPEIPAEAPPQPDENSGSRQQ